jgi:gliding motility-associated-like protein
MNFITRLSLVIVISCSFILKSFAAPSANFIINPSTICLGAPIVFTDASSGAGLVSWVWTFGSGANISTFNGQVPPTIFYATSGSKSVSLKVTDGIGNVSSFTRVINVVTATSFAGADVSICNTSSATLGAASTAGYTYNWSPSVGLSSDVIANPVATPATTTTYTLTSTAPNGCSAVDQVVVTNIGAVVANAGSDVAVCSGSGVSIGSSTTSGYTYTWASNASLSATNISNPVATPTGNTTYYLTVSAAGCTDMDTVVVTVKAVPSIGANDTIQKCFGATVSINSTPSLPGVTYLWSPSSFLNTPANPNPKTNSPSDILYTLTATNSQNCSAQKTVFIDNYDRLKAFAGLDQNVCVGNSIILGGSPVAATGGTGNYVYSWSPTSSLILSNTDHPIATPTSTATYVLTVTDGAGVLCGSSADTVVLTMQPLPHPVVNMQTIFCQGAAPVAISGLPSGGSFTGAGVTVGNMFNPSDPKIVLGTPYPITYTYQFNNCIYDTAISVVVFALPTANAGPDVVICKNLNQTSVTLSAQGGTSYSWTPSTGLATPTKSLTLATPTITTTYDVAVTSNGCTSHDQLVITISNTCGVDSILIANPDIVNVPMNKVSNIDYVINDNLLSNSHSYSMILFSLPKHGNATISSSNVLAYKPDSNYIGYDTLVYRICDTVNAAVSNPFVCDTAIVIIKVSPIVNNDRVLVKCDDSLDFNPLLNDVYGNGLYPISVVTFVQPKHGTVIWINNTVRYVANPGFSGLDTFSYWLCANVNFCTEGIVYVTVSCLKPPVAVNDYYTLKNSDVDMALKIFGNDTLNGFISFSVITNPMHGTYKYNTSSNTFTYTPHSDYVGNDQLQYVICNEVGCDTAWVYIIVDDNTPCDIPTGFSPNGDGVNDVLVINCSKRLNNCKFTIFNRWGDVIYSRIGYNNDWDGNFEGKPLPDGTYYYVFDPNKNNEKAKSGFIELKR